MQEAYETARNASLRLDENEAHRIPADSGEARERDGRAVLRCAVLRGGSLAKPRQFFQAFIEWGLDQRNPVTARIKLPKLAIQFLASVTSEVLQQCVEVPHVCQL